MAHRSERFLDCPYRVLGLTEKATSPQIRSAYLAQVWSHCVM